jgi:phosphoenolpyruvate-protein kinase (PTS system EI component)
MVEVAAAATLIATWAEHVDFFALGTNDLIASALGIDRENPIGASRDDPLHPGLLRIIHNVVEAAHAANRRVTVCGEMASDPQGTVALAALQVDALSVAVHQLDAVRHKLAEQALRDLPNLAAELARLRTATQVRAFLRQWDAS